MSSTKTFEVKVAHTCTIFDADAVLACTVAPDDEYDGYSAELHHHMDAVYGEGN